VSAPRYSQPLRATPRESERGVVFAGFVFGQPGFIVREPGKKELRKEATRENQAQEKPRGFLHSLARLMFGGRP
jgi:hypothetical protein